MKNTRIILILTLSLSVCVVSAQKKIQTAYDKATALNDRQEYLKAAKAFQQVQKMALQAGNLDMYIHSITAAGECYYMLSTATHVKAELDTAQAAYAQYRSQVSDSMRLTWAEAISKLEGSYESLLSESIPYYNPSKAIGAYERCLNILDTLRDSTRFDDYKGAAAVIHRELMSLYYNLTNYPRAYTSAKVVYKYYNNTEGYNASPRSDADRRKNRGFLDAYRSMAMVQARLQHFEDAEETINEAISICGKEPSLLRTKGKILMMHSDVDGVDRRGEAMGLYEQFIQMQKQQLSTQMDAMSDVQREQFWLNLHRFLFDCYRLEDHATEMLYDLALFSKGYLLEYQNKKAKTYTWKDIQKRLDAQSCAIEFVQYNGKDDRKQLAALVVTPDCAKPVFVHIADLQNLINMSVGGQLVRYAVASQNPEEKNALYNDPVLPGKIWTDELMAATGGATTLYFAADGILQQLAIEYMMPDPSRSCRRLTSTRMLLRDYKPIDTRKMLLFGGIDYGVRRNPSDQGNDELAYTLFQAHTSALKPLPGSRAEIETIARMRQASGDLLISDQDATDSAFRANAPEFPIILVSTHGFFLGTLQDGTDMRPPASDNAMSESGLAFAGCRVSLTDSTFDATHSDGILSARELAQIRLDSVGLVVLSACQSGLGTITADGVYGVQRALKQAGVRTLIVSLWSVDDEATSILMRNFFRNLQAAGKKADIYEAFTLARLQLMTGEYNISDAAVLRSLPKTNYADPRYADAFILIDVL